MKPGLFIMLSGHYKERLKQYLKKFTNEKITPYLLLNRLFPFC